MFTYDYTVVPVLVLRQVIRFILCYQGTQSCGKK